MVKPIKLILSAGPGRVQKPMGEIHVMNPYGWLKVTRFEFEEGDQIKRIVLPPAMDGENCRLSVSFHSEK